MIKWNRDNSWISRPAGLLAYCLALAYTGAWAQDAIDEAAIADNRDVAFYRGAIAEIESSQGAYAEGLQEQLLSLGLSLQQQGRHEEAVSVLKRGVHLARINNGLYSIDQIPLLQTEIASHMARGQFLEADERQMYLYRVQQRTLDRGEVRAQALMQQARWQRRAFEMGVGEQGFARLLTMWDLYRLALNDVVAQQGETSMELLAPLDGMLQSQYLIAGYQGETSGGNGFGGDDLAARQSQGRFNAYRSQSYKKGQAVIQAMYDIEQENNGGDKVAAAESLVMLGDWMLWHGERESAFEVYRDALMELAEVDDAQQHEERLFGTPVALPSLAGVRPLPEPIAPETGNLLLEFGVNNRGRVVDLERIETATESADGELAADEVEQAEQNTAATNRLMRKLRKTRFRPRFEDGEPVVTEKMIWAYDTSNW